MASNPRPDGLAHCTCFNLRKGARAVTQLYDAAMRPLGLTVTQFSVLGTLAEKGPTALGALAEELVTDRTTLTRNLGPLEARGLIVSAPGRDRRSRLLAVTDAGRELLAAALPRWRQVQMALVGELGEDQWRTLVGQLARVIDRAHTLAAG